jgi:O-antigen/teichoic acid export membrane protein
MPNENSRSTGAKAIISRKFASGAAILFTASVTTQILSLCGLLVIARLYSPEQVGSFAVAVAIGSIVATLVGGRLDLAIVTEQAHGDAHVVAKLATGLALVGAIVTQIGCLIFIALAGTATISPTLRPALTLLPEITLMTSLNMVGAGCAIRERRYGLVAGNQVMIAAGTLLAQITAIDWLGSGAALLAGFLFGQLCGFALLSRTIFAYLFPLHVDGGMKTLKTVAWAVRAFPLHTAPYSFVGQLYAQLPQLLVSFFYGLGPAGQYSNAVRLTFTPLVMLPTAIGQVMFGEMARDPNDKAWGYRVAAITAVSGAIMSVFVAAVLCAGPALVALLLGPKWADAGEIAQQVVVASFVTALVAGYDRIFDVLGLQKGRLLLILGSATVLTAGMLAAGMLHTPLQVFVLVIVTLQVISAANWSFWAFHLSRFPMRKLIEAWGWTAAATSLWWGLFAWIGLASIVWDVGRLLDLGAVAANRGLY